LTGDGKQFGKNESMHFPTPLEEAVKKIIHACVSNKMEVWFTIPGTLCMMFRGACPNLADRLLYRVKQ